MTEYIWVGAMLASPFLLLYLPYLLVQHFFPPLDQSPAGKRERRTEAQAQAIRWGLRADRRR